MYGPHPISWNLIRKDWPPLKKKKFYQQTVFRLKLQILDLPASTISWNNSLKCIHTYIYTHIHTYTHTYIYYWFCFSGGLLLMQRIRRKKTSSSANSGIYYLVILSLEWLFSIIKWADFGNQQMANVTDSVSTYHSSTIVSK